MHQPSTAYELVLIVIAFIVADRISKEHIYLIGVTLSVVLISLCWYLEAKFKIW